VDFFADKKTKLLKAKYGAKALVVYIALLCEAYRVNGYFLPWDEDACLLMSESIGCGCSPQYISEVVHGCLKRFLFDEEVFKVFGVLTSAGIQRRYIRAIGTREEIPMIQEYWLLNGLDKKDVPAWLSNKLVLKSLSEQKNEIDLQRNFIDMQNKPQSKVKERNISTPEHDAPVPTDSSKGSKKKIVFADDSVEMKLSRMMAKKMRENNPSCKIPQGQTEAQPWCKQFDYMLRIDGHSLDEIRVMIRFSQLHHFWKKNILSPRSLREKWDRLVLEMQEANEKADGDNY
jgi:hypothetical protein